MDSANFSNGFEHTQLYAKLVTTTNQSSEVFIEHYRKKYTEPFMPPLWQVTELMTLGELSKWVERTRDNNLKDELARDLGSKPNQPIENCCAH